MFGAELHVDKLENHFWSRGHGLSGLAASGYVWGVDGGNGGCCGCPRHWSATTTRGQSLCLYLFRNFYRLWIIFHIEFVYRSNYRQFQYAQEEGKDFININWSH